MSSDKKKIRQPDMKVLYMLSGGQCAKCKKQLFTTRADGNVSNLSEMAHIYGEKSNAARYLSTMTDEKRQSYNNLMTMCPTCHTEIDKDEITYTVEVLQNMKAEHEAEVTNRLENSINNVTCEELAMIIKYAFSSNTEHLTEEDYNIIAPKDKINKNNLSAKTENLITMGLANFTLIQDYINKQTSIDITFEQNLKKAFVDKYMELKEKNIDNEAIFAEIWSFAKGNKTDDNSTAAALSVIAYFFLECDIFEK